MKKPYIIAEIAQAHDGNINIAHAFIDAVAKTKTADAIKFQTHIAAEESTISEEWRKKFSNIDETRYEYWQRMEFNEHEWAQLKSHCEDVNLEFLSSPFSVAAANLLSNIGMKTWKIASGEVTNFPMIDYIAGLENQKFIISTGLCNDHELEKCIERIKKFNNSVQILVCTSKYPAPLEEIDLHSMSKIRKKFDCNVGLSDHSSSIYPSLAAYAMGASVLEVHVTFHKDYFGPDNPASITLENFIELGNGIDQLSKLLETNKVKDSANSSSMRNLFYKSIALRKDIKKGEILNKDNFRYLKPGSGISASEYMSINGSIAARDIKAGKILIESDISWEKK